MEDSPASRPARGARPPRRPERQQILLRRALALGAGLLVLILLVLGVKGCLDARKERALSGYSEDISQIAAETAQTSEALFGRFSDPGDLSVTEFVAEVNADRSAMDNYRSRIESLDVPGDMSEAQEALQLAYELRDGAMTTIADRMSTALGDVGSRRATAEIARQMRILMASDAVYGAIVKPEIDEVLADNGIEGEEVRESAFVPEGTRWLEASEVGAALSTVSGAAGAATPGVHGLGLLSTSIGGTELSPEATTPVSAGPAPEVEVQVQNQGESTENGVGVLVEAGGSTVQEDIDTIAPGETVTVTILLTPVPTGRVQLEVEVQPVPGEQVSDNNEATYSVEF